MVFKPDLDRKTNLNFVLLLSATGIAAVFGNDENVEDSDSDDFKNSENSDSDQDSQEEENDPP
ncbi:hypothetical protein MJO28_016852 [Puccinia striiformis f. sp. tritici]|nr:hypothetical protein MJO28_016852 [Puccinia striiformis f. sp. tritici]